MPKFRYSLDNGASWIAIDAALPYTIVCSGTDSVTVEPLSDVQTFEPGLSALTLSATTVQENTSAGTLVANILGKTASSTLSLTDNAGGRFALSGNTIVTDSIAADFETATSHTITIRETLAGVFNSPRDTTLTINVTNVFEQPSLTALTLSSTTATTGTATTINIVGATAGSTITGTVPTGMTLNSGTRTITGTPTTIGTYNFDITETLFDSANSPRVSNVTITVSEAVSPSLPFSSVNADGFSVEYSTTPSLLNPMDTFTVSRAGYDSVGSPTSLNQTLTCTQRVRLVYPNQATLSSSRVALSDSIYSTDTVAGVTNNSAMNSPKAVAKWVTLDQFVIGNTIGGDTQPVEITAFHRNGIAAVKFIMSDGTNTVSTTVSSLTISNNTWDKHKVLVYRLPETSLAGLNDNAVITVNAEVYPKVGSTSSIEKSADRTQPYEFSPRYYFKNTTRRAAPVYVYVNATTGVDAAVLSSGATSGGIQKVSTDPAIARANPFATLEGTNGAARGLQLATTLTGGLTSGCIIRVMGTVVLGSNFTTGTYQNTNGGHMIIERDPLDSAAQINFGSATTNKRMPYVLFRDIILNRVGALAIGSFYAQRVTIYNASQTAAIYGTFLDWEGVIIEGVTGSCLAGSSTLVNRLFRGVHIRNSANGSFPEPNTVVGCLAENGIGFGQQLGRSDRGIMAFNRFQKVTSNIFALAQTANLTGYAQVQNVVENIGTLNNSSGTFSADSDVGNTEHIIIWNNTVLGFWNNYRLNWAYTDGSATSVHTRTHYLWSVRGNILPSLNMKTDIFVGSNENNPTAAVNAVGNWSQRYGTGWLGNMTTFTDASLNGVQSGSNFGRDYGGLKAINGTSSTVRIDPSFTNYQGPTSTSTAGTGGGDYSLQSGSNALNILTASEEMLPYDIDGTARTRGSIGAYA